MVYTVCHSTKYFKEFESELQLNGPVNIMKVMSSRAVYLTTVFLDRLCPLGC